MDPNTNSDDNTGPSLRPPIFCPLCGAAHQFIHAVGEQHFILGRLRDLQNGYRCPTGDAPVVYTNNPNCVFPLHQDFQAQQQLLDHVAQFNNDYPGQGYHTNQHGAGSPSDHYDAHPNEEQPIEAPIYPRNSPTISEDSTVRLDGYPSLSTPPPKPRRTLSEASMEHIDEFSIPPIPPENSPDLSAASMEPLDHFSNLPIPQEDANQDQLHVQSGANPIAGRDMNQAATPASLQLLAGLNIFPRPERYNRSASMPAEGNVRYYQHVLYGTVPLPMPHRPESLPGSRSDWNAYQIWEEFPLPASERGGMAADVSMADDAEDDNESVDSDRTVTMAMVRNRENDDAAAMLRMADIPMPSVQGVEYMPMLGVEDIPIPSVEDH